MSELTKAIINVMKSVNGVEKNTTVGSGGYKYKGVSDKDVKQTYKKAMQENGLIILPCDIDAKVEKTSWVDQYGKPKNSYFTEVNTKYELMHVSGESKIIKGYGHGIDSGDKSAGKATTYALKYALLYTFMTPTGAIDDADKTHSNDIPAPHKKVAKKVFDIEQFNKTEKVISGYFQQGLSIQDVKSKMSKVYDSFNPEAEAAILELFKNR